MAGRAVILTTHSMEECEALCQRIGVLVKGELRALGTSQHLKTRFGQGFQVQLNVSEGAEERAMELVRETFDKVELIESVGGVLKLRCEGVAGAGVTAASCGRVFTMLESKRAEVGIVDYAVSQMTLEQIFISLVEKDEHPEGAAQISDDDSWKAQGFSAISLS
jgi:ABC-type multidrug transport system ATPase subunit